MDKIIRSSKMNLEPEIYLDAICLRIYDHSTSTLRLVNELIKVFDDNQKLYQPFKDEVVVLYKNILETIIRNEVDLNNITELNMLLLKLAASNGFTNKKVTDRLNKVLTERVAISDTRIRNIKNRIVKWLQWFKSFQTMKHIYKDLSSYSNTTKDSKRDELLERVMNQASDIANGFRLNTVLDKVESVQCVNMSSASSIESAIKLKDSIQNDGSVFKSGLKGLNDLLYPHNGILRGEAVGIMAPSHHYKSSLLMHWARWLATLNAPPSDCKGVPTIVFYSLENEVYNNTDTWFKELYINMYKEAPPDNMTSEEISNYVTRAFSAKGFTVLVYRFQGDDFGLSEYKQHIESLESEGYEILVSIIDYITLMNYSDIPGGTDAQRLQKFAHRLFDYNKHKLITTITAIQVKDVIDELIQNGSTNVAKLLNNTHLADCKGLYREFDIAIWVCLEENHLGERFVCFRWAKRRYNPRPPKGKLYKAYMLTKLGLIDDIHGKDESVSDIYTVNTDSDSSVVTGIAV